MTIYATEVTEDNLDYIIEVAADVGFNLDYLGDNMSLAAQYGSRLYVVMFINEETGNRSFVEFYDLDFHNDFVMLYDEEPEIFSLAERRIR